MDYNTFIKLCHEIDGVLRDADLQPIRGRLPELGTRRAAALYYLARKKRLPVTLNDLYCIYGRMNSPILTCYKRIGRRLHGLGSRPNSPGTEVHHRMPDGKESRIRRWQKRADER